MASKRNTQALSRIMAQVDRHTETEEYTGTMWVYLDEALRPYAGANILTEVEVTVTVSFENGPDGRTWEVIEWSATDTYGDSVEVDHEVALRVASDNV